MERGNGEYTTEYRPITMNDTDDGHDPVSISLLDYLPYQDTSRHDTRRHEREDRMYTCYTTYIHTYMHAQFHFHTSKEHHQYPSRLEESGGGTIHQNNPLRLRYTTITTTITSPPLEIWSTVRYSTVWNGAVLYVYSRLMKGSRIVGYL